MYPKTIIYVLDILHIEQTYFDSGTCASGAAGHLVYIMANRYSVLSEHHVVMHCACEQ
jgi:hypothetical protein